MSEAGGGAGPTYQSGPTDQSGPSEDLGTILITGLASGGDSVGRTADGRVVFVDGGVPGERVELMDARVQKRMIRAKVGRVVEASPNRVAPRCAHFGTCGGCRWQHVAYSAQLESKLTIVRDALERIGGLTVEHEVTIVPSPDPYAYRARARWVESPEGLGYRVRGSRELVPVESCPVLVPRAERALTERAESIARREGDEERPGKRRLRGAEWVVTAGLEPRALVQSVGTKASGRDRGKDFGSVSIEACGERLRVSSGSFVQGNALLWNDFATLVRQECLRDLGGSSDRSPRRFVELYAGIGFFTLPLARAGLSGVALESDRSAVADLKFNLRQAGLEASIEVLSGRVETRNDLAARFASADVLLIDPPRIGLEPGVRDIIAKSGPARFVYVSCDPATLARDLKELCGAGYSIDSLRAVDLFPQTPHVESVVRLERC